MGFFTIGTLFTIVAAILTLGVLILIHELGHFMVARMVGIRVERFSIKPSVSCWNGKKSFSYQISFVRGIPEYIHPNH